LSQVLKASVKLSVLGGIDGKSKVYSLFNQSLSSRAVLQQQRGKIRVFAGAGPAAGSLGFVIQPKFLEIMREHAAYVAQPSDNPYVAVHFRNTDLSDNLTVVIEAVRKKFKPYWHKFLYLATDSTTALKKFQAHLPNIRVVSGVHLVPIPEDCPYCTQHYAPHSTHASREKQFVNTLVDMYHIVRAHAFIPSKISGFSRWLQTIRSEESSKTVSLFSGVIL
jgi:hypothetical protein